MLGQLNIYGQDKIEVSIQRLKEFEPEEGYYLAFSGGKDSVCIKALADMAGVKYDAHYNITTVDPPELIHFIRDNFPDVIWGKPEKTMWKLIEEKMMPPTMRVRYCCSELKEHGGDGRFVVTGVRWAESAKRRSTRTEVEINYKNHKSKKTQEQRKIFLSSDNDGKRRMMEQCQTKNKLILNPIIDWEDYEVWEFIEKNNLPYCKLYDEGFKRLGCIGCPLAGKKNMLMQFERWPSYYKKYLKAFEKAIIARKAKGMETQWETAEDVMNWWIYGRK